MDDAAAVGIMQSVGDLGDEAGRLGGRKTLRPQQLRQRLAVHELRDQIGQAVCLTDFVDRHDSGVMNMGKAPAFAQEAVQILLAGEMAGARDFDRDDAVQLRVPGLVHGAERPNANRLEQLEPAQALLPGQGKGLGRLHPESRSARRTGDVFRDDGHQFQGMMAMRAVATAGQKTIRNQGPDGVGPTLGLILVGEEGRQLRRQVRMTGQELAPIGRRPRIGGAQIFSNHAVNAIFFRKRDCRVTSRIRCGFVKGIHGSVLISEDLAQFAESAPQQAGCRGLTSAQVAGQAGQRHALQIMQHHGFALRGRQLIQSVGQP